MEPEPRYRRTIDSARTSPSTLLAMDEKHPQTPRNDAPIQKPKSSWRSWSLVLCALLAGGWLLWPRCHPARVLSIEDRVHNILTQTPLIGEIKAKLE